MARKVRSNGSTSAFAFDKNKKYKYNSTGTLVEFTGTAGDTEITFAGSKSSLRRIEDLERNVSILAAVNNTDDGNSSTGATQTSKNTWNAQQTFDGGVVVGSNVSVDSNNARNLGSSSGRFATAYATTFSGTATTAQYADLAEIYAADAAIEPGTVVCFGGDAEVTTCDHDMDTKVAGVVSTNPAYLMNSEAEGVAVALTGRVPCKVTGAVAKGDMLVSAGNGMARAEANPAMGSVIGKALGNNEDGEGIIEVVVGRL